MLAVVGVVNLLTLMYYQHTDLRYSFIANFHYQPIHELLIFATVVAVGIGVGLCTVVSPVSMMDNQRSVLIYFSAGH